jgi:hypothetical protein
VAKSIRAASTPTPTKQSALNDALDDTFPASDPPSMTDPTHGLRASRVTLDDEAIRNRAYEIWQKAGCPDGSHEEHWAQARSELEAEAAGADAAYANVCRGGALSHRHAGGSKPAGAPEEATVSAVPPAPRAQAMHMSPAAGGAAAGPCLRRP